MRDIGPEEAKIRAQTGVGLSGLNGERDPYESPWRSVSYDPEQDRDPCPYDGKHHRK
jgi:hypothetical protein